MKKRKFPNELVSILSYNSLYGHKLMVRETFEELPLDINESAEVAIYELKGTMHVTIKKEIQKTAMKPKLGKIVKK